MPVPSAPPRQTHRKRSMRSVISAGWAAGDNVALVAPDAPWGFSSARSGRAGTCPPAPPSAPFEARNPLLYAATHDGRRQSRGPALAPLAGRGHRAGGSAAGARAGAGSPDPAHGGDEIGRASGRGTGEGW